MAGRRTLRLRHAARRPVRLRRRNAASLQGPLRRLASVPGAAARWWRRRRGAAGVRFAGRRAGLPRRTPPSPELPADRRYGAGGAGQAPRPGVDGAAAGRQPGPGQCAAGVRPGPPLRAGRRPFLPRLRRAVGRGGRAAGEHPGAGGGGGRRGRADHDRPHREGAGVPGRHPRRHDGRPVARRRADRATGRRSVRDEAPRPLAPGTHRGEGDRGSS